MKKFIIIVSITILTFSFSSCFKQKANEELKTQQILSYISDLQLSFDTLRSGILLHNTFEGIGNHYSHGDLVKICFTGIYLDPTNGDNNGYFAENDTFKFVVGNREILNGWNDLITEFGVGGVGIAIFPYDKAYGNDHTPNIPSNCSLVYFFRILSDNYIIDQTSLFWNYAVQYDSIMKIYEDSLIYVKYFDGLGPEVNPSGTYIDYQMRTISDSLITQSNNYYVDFNDASLPEGLIEGISLMSEGEMGKIILPPYLSYNTDNIFNIKPYSSVYYEARIISTDHDFEEKSKINKYLYVNNITPDSIIPTSIYYFNEKEGSGDYPTTNSIITYSDSLFLINNNYSVSSCDNCSKTLNSSNFTSGQIRAIQAMKKGGKASFIIPYAEAYGSVGSGAIPPYATLVYKITLDN